MFPCNKPSSVTRHALVAFQIQSTNESGFDTHLALQARRRHREVDDSHPRAQVRGKPSAWVSRDEQQHEVWAVIDVLGP